MSHKAAKGRRYGIHFGSEQSASLSVACIVVYLTIAMDRRHPVRAPYFPRPQSLLNPPTMPWRCREYEQMANDCSYLSIDPELRGHSKRAAFRINSLLLIGGMTWGWDSKACMLCDFTRKRRRLLRCCRILYWPCSSLVHTLWLLLARDKRTRDHSFNGMAVHARRILQVWRE